MRTIAAFLLLPLAVGIERFAWYGSRSAMYARFDEVGGGRAAMGDMGPLVLVGGLVAGLLAVALLPRVVLVAFGVLCAAGYLLAGTTHEHDVLVWGIRFAMIGSGGLKACLYGLALLVMPTPRLRTLYIVLTYLVVHGAAMIATPMVGLLRSHVGPSTLLIVAGVLLCAGLVPAVVVIVVDKLATRDARPAVDHGRALVGAVVMALCTAPLYAAMSAASRQMFDGGTSASTAGMIHGALTLATSAGLMAFAVYLLARGDKEDASPTPQSLIVGAALALGVVAALVALGNNLVTSVLAGGLFAIAEIAAPVALARGLANQHPRAVTLVAAFMLAFSWSGNGLGGTDVDARVPLLAGAFLCAVGAGLLIALGRKLDAFLDAPPAPPPESWLTGSSSRPPQ